MLCLRTSTPAAWLQAVCTDFDAFLVDHAACERKAAATGMSFVVRYPDRTRILDDLIGFAREELEHFHQVFALIQSRGLRLSADTPDPYVTAMLEQVRPGRDPRLLDRLLVAGVVEARGCERFGMVARGGPPEVRDVYRDFERGEARHHALFVRLARVYFDENAIEQRLDALLDHEAELVQRLPIRAALH